jgi:tetratricopeptide (TPR) repeat protein
MQQAWREADRGLVDIAGDSCRRALELAPFNPWPYYLQAQLAQIAGDTEQARILLGKAIYLDPQLVAAYLELAGLLEASSPARAKSLLRAACRELRRLPSDSLIKPYADTCAAAVLAYIEQRLSAPSRVAQLLTGDTPAVSAA